MRCSATDGTSSDPKVIAELAARARRTRSAGRSLRTRRSRRACARTPSGRIAHGVFGVPTLVIGEEIFWGHDALDMALDYLKDPEGFLDTQMRAIETLPVGIERRR